MLVALCIFALFLSNLYGTSTQEQGPFSTRDFHVYVSFKKTFST
uniref:Uncharacterized protein n=1 Tax=Setaria viridis TaxID=4556 RepID=A0A4U6U1T6_SETVI|nr:hypothetical protein SEVIR_6G103466v2 [Setaria viridis]